MQISFKPEERERLLRWLGHGAKLARDRHGAKATSRSVIWSLIGEALDIMDRVPDQERSWLSSGTRSGGWSQVGMTRNELVEIERLRVMSAMKPFEETGRYLPQKDDVARAVGVLEWLRWCSRGDDHSLQRAAVMLAKGAESAADKEFRRGSRRSARHIAYEIRTLTVGHILRGLREDAGIVPGPDGLNFVELSHAA